MYIFIKPTGTQYVVAGQVNVLRPVTNLAQPGPKSSSRSDRGLFNDKEYNNVSRGFTAAPTQEG